VIAFAGLVASIGLAYEYRGKVSDSLHDILKEGLNKYDNDTGLQKAIDLMQNEVSQWITVTVVETEKQKLLSSYFLNNFIKPFFDNLGMSALERICDITHLLMDVLTLPYASLFVIAVV